jgi:UDP-glucuronate 4-epimerase
VLTSDTLHHDIYHLSSDFRWSIEQWCELLAKTYPDFCYEITDDDERINLVFRPDHSPMSIDRLVQDTQYVPHFDLNNAFDDYVKWLEHYFVFLQ